MAARLGGIKQKKSSWGSVMNKTFLLFYSPKPRMILIYRKWSIIPVKFYTHVFCKYSACKSATLHAIYMNVNAVIPVACTVVRPSLCLNALDPAK